MKKEKEGIISETVEEVLARIKETAMKFKKSSLRDDSEPKAMHFFAISKPEFEKSYMHKVFHNKCLEKGMKAQYAIGYIAVRLEEVHTARAVCESCGLVYDEAKAKKEVEDAKKHKRQRKMDWKIEQQEREDEARRLLEEEKEKVLLGLL